MEDRELVAILAALIYHRGQYSGPIKDAKDAVERAEYILNEVEGPHDSPRRV